ncbi:MAG: calcium/sodium antiporter [Calditrichia bacterium]
MQILILITGLILLIGGAELLVRFSSALARSLGVRPLIVGLTIVSIGTSLPEFVVSLVAAIQNTMGISIGNIIGSNIANMGLILGAGAVLGVLPVRNSYLKSELPLMIFFTLLFSFFSFTHYKILRWEGIVLLLFLIFFLIYLTRNMQEDQEKADRLVLNRKQKVWYLLLALLGIVLLISGSKLTVDAGVKIATALGVSETVIGLTLIALGTSLPELATTLVGSYRGETEIVVGNVLGSNIFNLLFIGGGVAILRPIAVDPHLFRIDFPFLIIISILLWPLMWWRCRISHLEGAFLLGAYFLFIALAFLISNH